MNSIDDKLKTTIAQYLASGIEQQVDYEKFYLYSIITHSTAIEGSTVTEVENQLLFDEGIPSKRCTLDEQLMNLDLKDAYIYGFSWCKTPQPYTVNLLRKLASMVMRRTGTTYSVLGGEFDSSHGDLRLCNVSAGIGGSSYLSYTKVPRATEEFCTWLNDSLAAIDCSDIAACYRLSFEAHYRLVTIHPWVDGNGRTTRLLMNMIQRQLGLVPSIVTKENKGEYIQALIDSREAEDTTIIEDVMLRQHIDNLELRLLQYQKTAGDTVNDTIGDTVKSSDKSTLLLKAIEQHPEYTYEQYASLLGISRASIARTIKKLISDSLIRRIGSDKNGHWEIVNKQEQL